jgi:hypothetical protein
MPQFIYKSPFKVGPEATERQELMFETDLLYAISKDYSYIQDKDGTVFQINSPTELVEVNVTEEELQAMVTESLTPAEESVEDEEYCIECHNLMLIDQVINNTLLQKGQLSESSVKNMLMLAQLKHILGGV